MNLSAPFIHRPIATWLITLGVVLAGCLAFVLLPVAPLPQVDFPTISVTANLPGASPETMAATVATPLERALGSIAGVDEITSRSSLGSVNITLQFDLSRDINGAARDVQAAINAARSLLPTGLPNNPSYRKVNPADSPIMVIALTSNTLPRSQMADAASTLLAQRVSQLSGVGQVTVGGGTLPAVRVQLNPEQLARHGIALDTVRQALVNNNANRPKGVVEQSTHQWQIAANDRVHTAADFSTLILSHQNGASIRLRDVATVVDSLQDTRSHAVANGQNAIIMLIFKEPGANTLDTTERVRQLLPRLRSAVPQAINVNIISDRTQTIRAALSEVERAMAIAVGLVILVVLIFLRNWRAALVPGVAVPVSLAGTFCVMHLCGYSLNNLSAMALTVATGFVVDDAIVVLENINRHIEKGLSPLQASLKGTREIGFTVVSITLSLIAVFIPLLFMQGIVGRLFKEFAVVLCAAIAISMLVSLTTTPMMAATLLKSKPKRQKITPFTKYLTLLNQTLSRGYRHSLRWTLRHQPVAMLALLGVIALNAYLYTIIPKTFFPQQDTGLIQASVQADLGSSFALMQTRLEKFTAIIQADPAVASVNGSTGGSGGPSGGQRNTANIFISLKPLADRGISVEKVINRLRSQLAQEPGANLFMVPVQDIRLGGRPSNAQYQYTLQADALADLRTWEPQVRRALSKRPELTDISTDQQDAGLQTSLQIDRDAAARLGVSVRNLDNTLNNAFGQRQISSIYHPQNQYRVVMELESAYLQNPATLNQLYLTSTAGAQVPLAAFAQTSTTHAPLSINHQSGSPASTISFNLASGISLSQATSAIQTTLTELGVPTTVRGSLQGTANAFQKSLTTQPWLIAAAIVTIYLVLGMLYESLIHPITILSTLPSAGVGALLALMLFKTEFSIIAFIGVILLIGIVKKNAIMMIDFAISQQKKTKAKPGPAIFKAAIVRMRPIVMTTVAAIVAAIPLALGTGDGAELRQPLGMAIVGGLILSQLLTLYTTPVVFVLMDRLTTPPNNCARL